MPSSSSQQSLCESSYYLHGYSWKPRTCSCELLGGSLRAYRFEWCSSQKSNRPLEAHEPVSPISDEVSWITHGIHLLPTVAPSSPAPLAASAVPTTTPSERWGENITGGTLQPILVSWLLQSMVLKRADRAFGSRGGGTKRVSTSSAWLSHISLIRYRNLISRLAHRYHVLQLFMRTAPGCCCSNVPELVPTWCPTLK